MKQTKFFDEYQNHTNSKILFWNSSNLQHKTKFTYFYKRISTIYKNIIPANSSILEIGCGSGDLLASLNPKIGVGIDFSPDALRQANIKHPHIKFLEMDGHNIKLEGHKFDYIILSELLNDVWDVQLLLENLKPLCHQRTRIVFNYYSQLWTLPLKIARALNLARKIPSQNWLTESDINNFLEISGFQEVRKWEEIIIPINFFGLSNLINKYIAKLWPFKYLDVINFTIARPLAPANIPPPTASVIVAARNESGHIREILERIPKLGGEYPEVIFVEGNSTDDTFDVIKNEISNFPHLKPRLFKQPGKGKGDAVREGFKNANGSILMILDADITVPPEDLPRFYDLLSSGKAEFANGVRLVYPMQDDAMRPLNFIGNKFFSFAFSWLLGQPIRDTLCGTKVLWKDDYQTIANNRAYFGDFDPFGDFDLLFGAARQNLKILEVPIRYRARRYGETNISRWVHGVLLLKMVLFAARKIKFT